MIQPWRWQRPSGLELCLPQSPRSPAKPSSWWWRRALTLYSARGATFDASGKRDDEGSRPMTSHLRPMATAHVDLRVITSRRALAVAGVWMFSARISEPLNCAVELLDANVTAGPADARRCASGAGDNGSHSCKSGPTASHMCWRGRTRHHARTDSVTWPKNPRCGAPGSPH